MASQQTADATAPSAAAAASGEAPPSGASSTLVQNPTAATGATDLEKKMRRAERFGTPVVMFEEEKRSSRAERLHVCHSIQDWDSAADDSRS